MSYGIGIDIGSTYAKTVVADGEGNMLFRLARPTGWSSVDTAEDILSELKAAGYDPETGCVATGYGRISVPYATKAITEITCHARGACRLFNEKNLTVIDIGGQDTKIIAISGGTVQDFIMNDKCSAGTGRFLEVMAKILELELDELCDLARRGGGVTISSMCTVFAESEVISLIGKGESRENIAYAVVNSVIQKVASQAGKLYDRGSRVCLTGGLSQSGYVREALEQALGTPVLTDEYGQFAGAYGAALSALKL